MTGKQLKKLEPRDEATGIAVPPGMPAWITPALIAETIETWQPFYKSRLTVAEASTMLRDLGRLFGVLSRG